MAETALLFFSVLFTLGAFGEYYRDVARASIAPNRWSWLIWSATTGMEVATFQAVSGDWATSAVFVASAVACLGITALVWARATWQRPSRVELICVAASVLALIVWVAFKAHWWAHLVMLAAVPISFVPTLRGAWQDHTREDSLSWALWTVGDALALGYVLLRYESIKELPYAVVETAAHAAVWLVVTSRSGAARFRRTHAQS